MDWLKVILRQLNYGERCLGTDVTVRDHFHVIKILFGITGGGQVPLKRAPLKIAFDGHVDNLMNPLQS